jgi:sugar-specific transcriptional regulator TrmB
MMNKRIKLVMESLGLTGKHGLVLSSLWGERGGTPLTLARATRLNRSSIYRYLEDLQKAGLVEEIMVGTKKSSYRALEAESLEGVVVKQEAKLERLKETIPLLVKELSVGKTQEQSEVKYYRGVEGLRQMLWNVVASGKEYVGLGYENWNTSVGKSYAEKLRAKNMKTGVKSRELLNVVGKEYEYTSLKESYAGVYEHRVIDPKILEIKHDTYIYGDVFAYYYHYRGEYFGVEIHNAEIARTEKQIFDILWKMGEKVKK